MKRLIVTALDNNDEIWYRCFIPFILSLRQIDYQGDIGVIAYGLSEEKQQILAAYQIHIFEPANRFSNLLMDRQYSVAQIASQYDYEQIALYDADIWFASYHLTLFNQIQDKACLYCCYDVMYPCFLTNCFPENQVCEMKQKFDSLYQEQRYILQVGLMLGSTNAWINYSYYIAHQLDYLSGLEQVYGIDTSVLNLYAIATQQVAHLPEKYNCLPYWGITLVNQAGSNRAHFEYQQEKAEGIHITRYHRESKEYLYTSLCAGHYLNEGKNWATSNYEITHYTECQNLFTAIKVNNSNQLTVQEIYCYALQAKLDKSGLLYKENAMVLEFTGNFYIRLQNDNESEIEFEFMCQEKSNGYRPVHHRITKNNAEMNLQYNIVYKIVLQPKEILELTAQDLWQDRVGVRYLLTGIDFN